MSKSLSHVLVVFKVARILAKISFILCIIGGVGSLLGGFMLPVAYKLSPALTGFGGLDIYLVYCALVAAVFATAGAAVFAFLSERYFKNVLRAGTPFTAGGARECFRLGIASLIISASVTVATAIVLGVMELFAATGIFDGEISVSFSATTGLFFLFLSMLFKHGAELRDAAEEQATERAE